jgi:protein involved in polysaccharide export with SLBB domain
MKNLASLVPLVVAALGSAPGALVAQDVPIDWEPERLNVERRELQDLLEQWEAVASSPGYSSGQREDAVRQASLVRERLTQGDFRVGDRIALQIQNELTDTFVVNPGPSIVLENMGTISLAGILRSELTEHLTRELSVYIRDPVVRASATLRIQMEGAVGGPGFYTFESDLLLSETIMRAGGPGGDANLEEVEIRRGEELLMEGEEVSLALQNGRSLDQLNLRGGDRIIVPEEGASMWPMFIRWGAIIASTTLLGVRIFY